MAATESCPRAKCHESHPSSVAELVQHLWLPHNCYGEVMGLCLFLSSFLLVKREGRRVRERGKKKVASSIRKLVRFVFLVYYKRWSSQVMQGNYRWWKLRSQPLLHCETYCFSATIGFTIWFSGHTGCHSTLRFPSLWRIGAALISTAMPSVNQSHCSMYRRIRFCSCKLCSEKPFDIRRIMPSANKWRLFPICISISVNILETTEGKICILEKRIFLLTYDFVISKLDYLEDTLSRASHYEISH